MSFNPSLAVNMLIVAGIALAIHLIMFVIVKLAFMQWQAIEKVKLVKYLSVFEILGKRS